MGGPRLRIAPVRKAGWADLERLFESRGAPHFCWCMLWRGTPAERQGKPARKAAMRERVEGGVPVGLLGYLDGEPVAWCSVAPRESHRDLGGPPDDRVVWSITCFFVPRRLRGLGLFPQLLEAAVAHARAQGAEVVEAYPVDPESPSYRFMGLVGSFEELGFERAGRAGSRRHVVRLVL